VIHNKNPNVAITLIATRNRPVSRNATVSSIHTGSATHYATLNPISNFKFDQVEQGATHIKQSPTKNYLRLQGQQNLNLAKKIL
jgi:hypothetical protein